MAKLFNKVEKATAPIRKMLLIVQANFRELKVPRLLAESCARIKSHDGARTIAKARKQLPA